jgi:WD40 repeat protein/serine/threonine protein kinase
VDRVKADLDDLFCDALELASPAERAAYLDRVCGDDLDLRRRLERLLEAHEAADGFLAAPAAATVDEQPFREGPGTVIGPYKLLEQIGEGGFGVVFMAEQNQPIRRKIALKVLKPGMDTKQVVARFEAERQALALMDHPHIAKVLDAGTTESGRPYFVMELVRGIPITQFCDVNQLAPRQRLELFITVCQAVQHAHQKGIIHRDLKPSNVLVTLHDATPVVKVIDFGIAKALGQHLTDKTLFTGFAQMLGTPLYMSPEQAELSGLDVDTRSDIYSLGVLLYELLTGTTPLDEERLRRVGYDELRRLIREEEPPLPSTRLSALGPAAATVSANRRSDVQKLSRLLRGELDWIVLKALEKDRSRRYETASAFAADVRRYLSDEPVEACPPSALYRFRKFARRNKAVLRTALVVAVALALAVAALAVSTTLTWRANRDLQQTLERERQNGYYQRIALAEREGSANNLSGMLRLLDECPADLRGWEWCYLKRLRYTRLSPLRHEGGVLCAVFSPDGGRIASCGEGRFIRLWDAQTGQELQRFCGHEDRVYHLAFSPDGQYLASGSWDGTVKIWHVATGQELHTLRGSAPKIWCVAFSPDGRWLASGGGGESRHVGEVKVWEPATGQARLTLSGDLQAVYSVAFSPDGRQLATGGADHAVRVWDVQTGQEQRTYRGHNWNVWSVAFSPDGRRVASVAGGGSQFPDQEVKIWDADTGHEVFALGGHVGGLLSVAFTPDGRRLASAGVDQTVKIWDLATGREVLTLRGHSDRVHHVAFSHDGHRLLTASTDRTVRVWDATPPDSGQSQELLTLRGHQGLVTGVAFSPTDARCLVSVGGKEIKVWDALTGTQRQQLPSQQGGIQGLTFSPDGRRVATWGASKTVRVWDLPTGKECCAFSGHTGAVLSVAFSPDGRLAASGGFDFVVRLWDPTTGRPIRELSAPTWPIHGVAFSPDRRHLASGSAEGTVRIWALTTGQKVQVLAQHTGRVTGVAFSADGRYLASASADRTVKVWDTVTWQLLRDLPDPTGGVASVTFSPDGRWLAWGGTDATVKATLWTAPVQEIHTFRGHASWVTTVSVSPDGERIASASLDGTVRIWQVPSVAASALPAAKVEGVPGL